MKFINDLVVKLVDTKDLKSLSIMERKIKTGLGYITNEN